MSLRPVRFDWKEEMQIEQKQIQGFIAQEVESVLPDLVYGYQYNDTETKKSIKMGDMIPTLVKAIQEQQAIINDLKARIEALEKK
jgi:5'-deoxynucleotidase YfbR-like HD superfamily hydrolase